MDKKYSINEFFSNLIDFTSGCTEPAAIAYNASIAGDYLKNKVNKCVVKIDSLTYKNAYLVGIPNAKGYKGSKWAYLFGYLIAEPSLKLEIFKEMKKEKIEKAEKFLEEVDFNIEIVEKPYLYIETEAESPDNRISVVTTKEHTNIKVYINEEIDRRKPIEKEEVELQYPAEWFDHDNWEDLVERIYSSNNDAIKKFKTGINYNLEAAEKGDKYINFTEDYGVAGAVYSRMNGDDIPVMSCAKSGNKGLTSVIPVVKKAQKLKVSEAKKVKSAILSCFIAGIISEKFGTVSSICGCVYAAAVGVIAGSLYLENKLDLFFDSFQNYISSTAGVFCDGAKGSCAMKTSNSVLFADKAISFAKNGFVVSFEDGYLGNSFVDTLENLKSYNKYFKKFDKKTIQILNNKKL
ncbi:MAG: hypothetical protein FXF47_03065 [Candidatus Mcinerneyibacterium aminivorans]|uniref:Serine dehydratase-like alpha subunit domain-containing protein n=1 Tax=Candidatus Mcinerneyibacterium aminivorans TaxID=2703815 RepID=A0A5D0MJ87_9BACT|nr:MAG: hypothetical protein FXF47_03065 [Candidatus Mcinerneyibacterium aminivorans]